MKKLFISIVAAVLVVSSAQAATVSMTVKANTYTNLLAALNGSIKVSQIIVSAGGTPVTNLTFIDTPTNTYAIVNSAYTNTSVYATNYISLWTNYWGGTNYVTNLADVIITNSVAASTNNYPIRLVTSVLASTANQFNGSYWFNNGIWVTNSVSNGDAVVTITYQQ